jgi:hypothetical protein
MKYLNRKVFLLFIALVVVKIPGFTQNKVPGEVAIFPPPPDTTRIQFLSRISSSEDIKPRKSAFWRYIFGEEPPVAIQKPYGIASSRGKIVVCDVKTLGLDIIDLEKKEFQVFIPKGRGMLKKPINCDIDQAGFIYVADIQRHQIVIFSPDLQYMGSIGSPNDLTPVDVEVDETSIYVTDKDHHVVKIYDKLTHDLTAEIPQAAPKTPEYLYNPINLDVQNDYIYVTDFGDFKAKIYDKNGNFIRSIGSYGKAIGQFVRPKGIAVDPNQVVHVVDAAFENVQMFTREGELLMFYGGPYEGPGYLYLPAQICIDTVNMDYFKDKVLPGYRLKFLILVTNQYGPDKVTIYGFIERK